MIEFTILLILVVTGLVISYPISLTVRWFWKNKINRGNRISPHGEKKQNSHCVNCGNELPENNNFCIRCGYSKEQPHPEQL